MTVLRGPADADHYRVKVGRYGDRWYADPLPLCDIAPATDDSWPSFSTIKAASGKDWTFVGLKRVAQALEEQPDTLAGLDYANRYDRLKSINKNGLNRAGNRGTMVHTYFERALRGEALERPFDDDVALPYLPAVSSFFDRYQPELVAAELVCINRDLGGYGYGCTSDALLRIDGETYWVDWKSRGDDSDHGAYPEEGAQVAAAAAADYYIAEGPKRLRMPAVTTGLVVSVKTDGIRIYPVDLTKATEHWVDMHMWWVARRNERDAIGKPWAPRAASDLDDRIASAPSAAALVELWAANITAWTPAHSELAKARKALLAHQSPLTAPAA